jgi:hypothetical protein
VPWFGDAVSCPAVSHWLGIAAPVCGAATSGGISEAGGVLQPASEMDRIAATTIETPLFQVFITRTSNTSLSWLLALSITQAIPRVNNYAIILCGMGKNT